MTRNGLNSSTTDFLAIPDDTYEFVTDVLEGESKYLCYLIPTYDSGSDSTHCYYINGKETVVPKPIKTVMRRFMEAEGLQAELKRSMTDTKPMYTDPRTYGPHMTFAYLKVRPQIGRSVVYGLFNIMLPTKYRLSVGPSMDTCYLQFADFEPVLIYHSLSHTKKKLEEARAEHRCYLSRWLGQLAMTSNKMAVSELFAAWQSMFDPKRLK